MKTAVFDGCDHQIALIDSSLTDFERHVNRLRLVREQKQKLADMCGINFMFFFVYNILKNLKQMYFLVSLVVIIHFSLPSKH